MIFVWECLRQQRFDLGRYSLVPVLPEHIEPIRCWRNAQLDILRQAAPISPAQQQAYFGQNIWPSMALAAPPNILMALLLENGLIGYGGLVHLSWENRRGELSFLVDDKRAKDLAQYATDFASFLSLAKFMAFDDLGLNRIFTETFALRVHHISVLETAGFQREGVMREHVKIGDSFVDSIVHGLLRE